MQHFARQLNDKKIATCCDSIAVATQRLNDISVCVTTPSQSLRSVHNGLKASAADPVSTSTLESTPTSHISVYCYQLSKRLLYLVAFLLGSS
jgi:hypothetical protein